MLLPVFLMLAAIATIALGAAEMLALDTKAKAVARVNRYETVAVQSAQSNLIAYLAQAEQQSQTVLPPPPPPMGQTSLCDQGTPCGYTATANYVFDGNTQTTVGGGNDTVTAANVEGAVAERRIGVTITVNILDGSSSIVATRPHRKIARVWNLAPYAEILGDQDSGARANRTATGSSDAGGCAPDGTGCDPNRVNAVDPSTLDARTQCNLGVGSGTCAPNEMRNAEQKRAVIYQNQQAGGSNGP